MNDPVLVALNIAQGPVFRFALALAVFGLVRLLLLGGSDALAAYIAERDREALWHKVRLRLVWLAFPTLTLHRVGLLATGGQLFYHVFFSCISLVFRVCSILVPIFMVAHVHLWERGLGISWPALPGTLADTLSYLTIITGFALFLGRVYSPVVRRIERPWSFLRPLIVLLPFVTGVLAMHPTWCPLDYHLMLLLHVLCGSLVLALLPFARLLSSLQVRLDKIQPEAAWQPEGAGAGDQTEDTTMGGPALTK
jgi:hypothetical protein